MISTTGEYALRAAVFLAFREGTPQTAAVMAEGTQIPQGYLSKIMQQLVRGGLVKSQRGLHGGFVLARPAGEITVFDVLDAVGAAPARIVRCPLGIAGHEKLCPVHKLVDEAAGHAEKAFRATSLRQLARSTGGVTPLCGTEG